MTSAPNKISFLTSNKSINLSSKRKKKTVQKLGADSLFLTSNYEDFLLPHVFAFLVRICCTTIFVKFQ